MKNLLLASIASILWLTACGSDDPNNVEACEQWVQSVKCGTIDISTMVTCSSYASLSCDIGDYFECLSEKYVCVNGMYDSAKLATLGECAPKATCN